MNYSKYELSKREWIKYVVEYLVGSGVVIYLFYDSLKIYIAVIPLIFLFIKRKKKEQANQRITEIKNQFVQMILSISSALSAGYSIENALSETLMDMRNMYEEESVIVKEIKDMIFQMRNGSRIEDLMQDFAERTGAEEIKDFANVFAIARKNGGNFSVIIRNCANIMRSGRETETEIQVLISGKRFEQRIMNVIPFVMIACLKMTSPELIGVLYHNALGIIVMTICLCIYFAAIIMAEKISNIRC